MNFHCWNCGRHCNAEAFSYGACEHCINPYTWAQTQAPYGQDAIREQIDIVAKIDPALADACIEELHQIRALPGVDGTPGMASAAGYSFSPALVAVGA